MSIKQRHQQVARAIHQAGQLFDDDDVERMIRSSGVVTGEKKARTMLRTNGLDGVKKSGMSLKFLFKPQVLQDEDTIETSLRLFTKFKKMQKRLPLRLALEKLGTMILRPMMPNKNIPSPAALLAAAAAVSLHKPSLLMSTSRLKKK